MPNPLRSYLTPDHAQQFVDGHIANLTDQDRLPEPTARRIVETALAAGDPWYLADAGQLWVLRDDIDPEATAAGLNPSLLIIRRYKGGQLTVEDEQAQSTDILTTELALYELAQWYWSSPEHLQDQEMP